MSFQRKGAPEKINTIKVQGNVKGTTKELRCESCGKTMGTQKGAISIVGGIMTVGLGSPKLVCSECRKGK